MIDKNQIVEVKIAPANFKHFKNLGYDVHKGDIIEVPLNHIMKGSNIKIPVECDCCHEKYYAIYKNVVDCDMLNKKNYCKKCIAKMTMKEKYGVESVFSLGWVHEKIKNTKVDRYGEDYTKYENEKRVATMVERYGVEYACQLKEFDDKRINTVLDRYGGYEFSQNPEVRKKREQTCLERYGAKSPIESQEIKEKIKKSLAENSNVRTSSQQTKILNIIKKIYKDWDIELNYAFRNFNFDIALIKDDIKIDIEYDGWYWHTDDQTDRRRDEVSKSYGWKILRIKSGHKIPTNEQLEEAINKLINGYSYTEIKLDDWKEAEIA